jgi:hypothetical protein
LNIQHAIVGDSERASTVYAEKRVFAYRKGFGITRTLSAGSGTKTVAKVIAGTVARFKSTNGQTGKISG